jgi:Uma2 family endonuclease
MAAKTLISEAEFLRMTFDGPEPEYVDGEVVERSMPNLPHSRVQGNACVLMHPFTVAGYLFAFPELRIKTGPRHYRTPDVTIYRDREPTGLVPPETPFIVIEVVSPGDSHEELMTKLAEYAAMGVTHAWIVEPGLESLSVYDRGSLLRVDAFELPEFSLRFTARQLLGR